MNKMQTVRAVFALAHAGALGVRQTSDGDDYLMGWALEPPNQIIPPAGVKIYDYFYDGDKPVKSGDFAVVQAPHGTTKATAPAGLIVVQVVEVLEGPSDKATKHIVDIVDISAYKRRLANAKARRAIVKRLEEKERLRSEEERFASLAATDPEAAELLRKLREIE